MDIAQLFRRWSKRFQHRPCVSPVGKYAGVYGSSNAKTDFCTTAQYPQWSWREYSMKKSRKQGGMKLKQIGMRAGMMKSNSTRRIVSFIDENPMKNPANKSQGSSLERKFILLAGYAPRLPIRLNMTSPFSLKFSMQGMIFVLGQQGLFVKQQAYYIIEFVQIFAAFFHQLALLLERTGKCRLQHGLIVRVQIRQHFFNRIVPLCRYLSSEHSVAFFKSRDSLGVKTLFPRYRVAVRGADRTFAGIRGGGFRDGIGRHMVSVRNTHGVSIA